MENPDIETSIQSTQRIDRKDLSEETYIQHLDQEYETITNQFPKKNRQEKKQSMSKAFQIISDQLAGQEDLPFGKIQYAILKLKLARHFEKHDEIDLNTLFDAIIETPNFINKEKGSLHHLLEIHQQKTLQKIAKMRKERAKITNKQDLHPFEILLGSSGNYHLVKLLNRSHLMEESTYMKHCVGTSDSYLNRMKRGEIEIFSFRHSPLFNPNTEKLAGDTPLLTIEYNPKTGVIQQIKKQKDQLLYANDPFLADFIDILKRFPETKTDAGNHREIKYIDKSELRHLLVKPYHLLTERGAIHFRDLNPQESPFILKVGEIKLTTDISREEIVKLLHIFEKLDFRPEHIARTPDQINDATKVYAGSLVHKDKKGKIIPIFDLIQQYHIEHIYTSFPEGKITRALLKIGEKTIEELKRALKDKNVKITQHVTNMLHSSSTSNFTTLKDMRKNPETVDLVLLKLGDLDYTNATTTQELFQHIGEYGLELMPAEVGPHYCLAYMDQPIGEWFYMGMEPIKCSFVNYQSVFGVLHYEGRRELGAEWGDSDHNPQWWPDSRFLFRLRK